jgi:hypothetical protein
MFAWKWRIHRRRGRLNASGAWADSPPPPAFHTVRAPSPQLAYQPRLFVTTPCLPVAPRVGRLPPTSVS